MTGLKDRVERGTVTGLEGKVTGPQEREATGQLERVAIGTLERGATGLQDIVERGDKCKTV